VGEGGRSLITRIGKLELRVPRDRNGEFSTALFDRKRWWRHWPR
jgi:putative transposase